MTLAPESSQGGGSGESEWTVVTKAIDQSIASNVTPANDDELFFVTVAGAAYMIDIFLIYASPAGGATPDFKFSCGEDTTYRGALITIGPNTTDSATQGTLGADLTTSQAWGTAAGNRAGETYGPYLAAGGTFRFRWSQNTSGLNPTILRAGSTLSYRLIL